MTGSAAEPSPVQRPGIIPPMVLQPGLEQLDSPVTLSEDTEFPIPTFTTAKVDRQKRRMPQCIAHRGFKARFPENTLLAFEKALDAGAVALETDLHVTKDKVVVLSHDATLKRCFGQKDKIIDRTWDEIKDLETLAAPHEHMPRLKDLLHYLSQPEKDEVWTLLDIKLDNNADDIMRLISTTIAEVEPSPSRPWNERIVLGIWAAKYLPLALKYLPGFPVVHIGFKLSYARHFFDVPNVGFNMLLPMLMAPGGKKFISDCQKNKRQLFAWTVNDKDKMEWCIRRRVDGVITDDPSMFVEACESHDEYSAEPIIPVGFKSIVEMLRIYIIVTTLFWVFRRRLNPTASSVLIERTPRRA